MYNLVISETIIIGGKNEIFCRIASFSIPYSCELEHN